MLLFIVSILLYLIPSMLLCWRIFHQFSFGKWVIVFFIGTYSFNILIFQILHFFSLINQPWAFIFLQFLFCSVISFLILRDERRIFPTILQDIRNNSHNFKCIDYFIISIIVIILSGFFYIGIRTPIDNIDSLQTHLPRIFYWLQHGSFDYWPALNWPQLAYPHNAHIQGLWLFLFSRQENLFFLVQWFSIVVIVVTIFKIARLLKFSQTQSLISSLLVLSFPILLLQTYSFQGDLAAPALLMVIIFLLFSYLNEKKCSLLVFALLPLALSLGTKQTAFFILPVFGILILYWSISGKIVKAHIPYLSLFIIFFFIFSSFKYIQNKQETNSFFGIELVGSDSSFPLDDQVSKIKYNLSRYLYQFISFDGTFISVEKSAIQAKAILFEKLFSSLHMDLESPIFLQPGHDASEQFNFDMIPAQSEDTSWFGPLSFSLLPLAMILALLRREKPLREYLLFTSALAFSYVLIITLQRPGWDPYQGRYFIMAVLPLTPLTAGIIPYHNGMWKALISIPVALVVLILSSSTLLFNNSKPIITQTTIYNFQNKSILPIPNETKVHTVFKTYLMKASEFLLDSSISRRSIFDSNYYEKLFFNEIGFVQDIELVNQVVPENSTIYILMGNCRLEYALFGRGRTRNLYPISDIEQMTTNGYLITDNIGDLPLSPGFIYIESNKNIAIYKK